MTTNHKNFLSHSLGRGSTTSFLPPENPYAPAFHALTDAMKDQIECRTIRAWHYTRLTDPEVAALRCAGIHLSTPATLRARLNALVKSGDLGEQIADALYAASPFNGQREIRSNKFWMVSHPLAVDDGGVKPLMAHWAAKSPLSGRRTPLYSSRSQPREMMRSLKSSARAMPHLILLAGAIPKATSTST